MKRIAIEEHFFTQAYVDYMRSPKGYEKITPIKDSNWKQYELLDACVPVPGEMEALLDVGKDRLQAMDEVGIDIQVLSFSSPGVEAMDVEDAKIMAKKVND